MFVLKLSGIQKRLLYIPNSDNLIFRNKALPYEFSKPKLSHTTAQPPAATMDPLNQVQAC